MNWHRQFGLLLTDIFAGSPFEVELEKDLSHQQQFLDVIVIRKQPGDLPERLPDGLDNLVTHNLITFKSHQETLDDWALKELTGHYVSYRKHLTPRHAPLLPESEFGLYAVCGRYPQNLAQALPWEQVQEGVYCCRRGTDSIVIVVTPGLANEEHNAPLHMISGSPEKIAYARAHFRLRSPDTSTLLNELFQGYRAERLIMPYTMADFRRDYAKEHFKDLTAEERREALESLSPEERREFLKGLSPEERVEGMAPEELEAILERIKAGQRAGKQKPTRKRK